MHAYILLRGAPGWWRRRASTAELSNSAPGHRNHHLRVVLLYELVLPGVPVQDRLFDRLLHRQTLCQADELTIHGRTVLVPPQGFKVDTLGVEVEAQVRRRPGPATFVEPLLLSQLPLSRSHWKVPSEHSNWHGDLCELFLSSHREQNEVILRIPVLEDQFVKRMSQRCRHGLSMTRRGRPGHAPMLHKIKQLRLFVDG
ncbi:hypothetical protein HG530_007431 [Fusarium avenaceum]|nr:hypothetical protein HG530_007431 [Fusarium avenaceum]